MSVVFGSATPPVFRSICVEQIKYAIETGALRGREQLPAIRRLAEDLVMNPNTVVRAYRELEHEGIIELRHGSDAYIADAAAGHVKLVQRGQALMQAPVEKLIPPDSRTRKSAGLWKASCRETGMNGVSTHGARAFSPCRRFHLRPPSYGPGASRKIRTRV
ncbi:MAG TPA: GntR family transcriptional regulator [Bryobacteraceae bacterium]|nr:GntR family transcriptional regulator [Bryobacteraceae bacterium]